MTVYSPPRTVRSASGRQRSSQMQPVVLLVKVVDVGKIVLT